MPFEFSELGRQGKIRALTFSLGAAGNPPILAQPDDPPKPAAPDDPYTEPPPRPLTRPEKLKRDALFREGKVLITQEKWREAAEKLREGLRMQSDAEMLLWLGYAEEQLDKFVTAKKHYTQARAEATAAKLTEIEQRASAALEAVNKSLPRIKLKLPEGTTVMVYLDEVVVKFWGEGLEVDPGTRTLQVTSPGRKDFRTQVILRPGEVQTVEVLLPLTAPPPSVPTVPPPKGCGCRTVGEAPEGAGAMLALGALGLLRRRRAARH